MLNLRSILCAVDFSDASRRALQWAIAMAGEWNSRVIVLTAVDPLLAEVAHARFALDLVKTDVEPALRQLVDTPANRAPLGGSSPELLARIGEPSKVILQAAGQLHPDLIVIGTHGLSGFKKLVLGSTAERVLRTTPVPVLAVPAPDQSAPVAASSPLRLEIPVVLGATDFSEPATRAIQCAAAIAQRLDARLLLTHVVAPLNVPSEFQRYVEGVDEDATAQARALLESQGRAVAGTVAVEVVLELGYPADCITSIARTRGAGLIVMGLASEEGAHAVRPGAIAYRVLCQSHVPVLVVPRPASS